MYYELGYEGFSLSHRIEYLESSFGNWLDNYFLFDFSSCCATYNAFLMVIVDKCKYLDEGFVLDTGS